MIRIRKKKITKNAQSHTLAGLDVATTVVPGWVAATAVAPITGTATMLPPTTTVGGVDTIVVLFTVLFVVVAGLAPALELRAAKVSMPYIVNRDNYCVDFMKSKNI